MDDDNEALPSVGIAPRCCNGCNWHIIDGCKLIMEAVSLGQQLIPVHVVLARVSSSHCASTPKVLKAWDSSFTLILLIDQP